MMKNQHHLERLIASFDSFRMDRVQKIQMDFQVGADSPVLNVLLVAEYIADKEVIALTIQLLDVRQFSLPRVNGLFQFGELEISDITSHGLEGLRYHLNDPLEGFSCYCRDIHFLGMEKANGLEVKWG